MEMTEIIYHAIAITEDNKSMYIVSKQRASMKKDDKTRKDGEQAKRQEYLVMMQLAKIIPTTAKSHGHTLGKCSHIMRHYCAQCVAGCGICYHHSSTLWMQYMHWGEGRPTPKPCTSDFSGWVPGSKADRSCSNKKLASLCGRVTLPNSEAEAKMKTEHGRVRSCQKGVPALFKVHESYDKMAMFDDPRYSHPDRFLRLYACLEAAQLQNQFV